MTTRLRRLRVVRQHSRDACARLVDSSTGGVLGVRCPKWPVEVNRELMRSRITFFKCCHIPVYITLTTMSRTLQPLYANKRNTSGTKMANNFAG